jgi:hypothetical protein
VRPFPSQSQQDLQPGIYDSNPPFAVEFLFRIPDDGWQSAHIHEEFFDVMRFDGASPTIPTRWVAFGFPQTLYGPDGVQPVDDVTPAEAIDLISNVPNVAATNTRPFTFAGRDGVQVDLRTDVASTHIFGGDAGDLGLDPSFPARLGAVAHDPGLLIVMCFGAPDIDEGCADAQPIIDSVELP